MYVRLLALGLTLSTATLLTAADADKSADAVNQLRAALAAGSLADIGTKDFATVPLTKADAARARELLWKKHAASIQEERAGEIKDGLLKDGKQEMPFTLKTFGEKPAGGRSLWISLHGGGGAPKEVNDR